MAALKSETGGKVRFSGVGGDNMAEEGLQSLFPMEELSIMGFAEVLPRLPNLLRRIGETANAAIQASPNAVVSIDSPGFCLRVVRRLKGQGFPLIHYVAPQIWAWRPGRARKIADTLDYLLALLPFEPPHFEKVGLTCDFVGHSVVEESLSKADRLSLGQEFRVNHGFSSDSPLLTVLPGSRRSEVDRLLPVFGETVETLTTLVPGLQIVVPTLVQIETIVRQGVEKWHTPATVVTGADPKRGAFAAADAALAASGTVSLELAAARVPTVIAYKLNPISAWIGRRVIQVPWISLTNIILNRSLVPEFIQEECQPEILAPEVLRVLTDSSTRTEQEKGAEEVLTKLGLHEEAPPSLRAARAILAEIASRS